MSDIRNSQWWRLTWHALPVYVLSRLCVLAGAAVVAAELRVDVNLADERGLALADPHIVDGSVTSTGSAVHPMLDVLTSWDGLWYMEIVRHGYPESVPADVTYHMDEARAAFFPLFPALGRLFDMMLPGGDSLAVLTMNTLIGFVAVVLIGLLGYRLYGERVGRTTTTLVALFPGSFVLTFAYSESLMLMLAAACMLCLHDRRWLLAGVFAALTTATRPNGLAIVLCCMVAAFIAIRDDRDWRALASVLLAPIGFIAFQIWLGQHTGEAGVWFRVQREAWGEGASFGWTAIKNTGEAIAQPLTSPTDTITAVGVVCTVVLLWMGWKAKQPAWMNAYSWAIIALMLAPATVTARPRFLFTAFPLLIGAAVWFEQRHRTDDRSWAMTMAACGAGLVALTGLYGVFGAIPVNERWSRRAWAPVALLALLAYVPALTAAPGRMPADSKLYLYLDPARFLGDAASSFDRRQFAGWVPHQHIAYLWPSGPWYWLFEQLSIPDWIAHRLWIGSLMLAAGLGVRWCARLLGLAPLAALVAALVYQLSPYVLPYVSRTSVMLLPWAGLGWIVGFTIRATRRRTWGDPAAVALLVFTVGAVNATALAMIVPAPTLWLVHTAWQRALSWRQAAMVGLRVVVLTIPVCLWWMAMLVIQGRFGAEVLPYSESLADVSLTSTGPEVWRSLGYWLFYVRDSYAATTTESLRYLTSSWSIVLSYLLPIVCLAGLVWVRWAHRRFAALLIAAGAVLAVGVHPIDDRSPLMRLVAGDDDAGLALALRSSTRALPVMNLGLALLAGALVAACADVTLRRPAWRADVVLAAGVSALAIVNLPSLWTGAFVDPALERDQDPPTAWSDAAAELDRSGPESRVLQLPGAEFGAFRWGYTVDQPLPGLTEKPLVTRDLLPLGSAAAMDLVYALDDRIQDGVFEPASLAPVSRWLGADTVWLTNDLAFDRFRTARPQTLTEQVDGAPGVGEVVHVGEAVVQETTVPMIDERSIADPAATAPVAPVDLYPIEPPGTIVRAEQAGVVVSGSGDGLVDAAAAGLLGGDELVRYSASIDGGELADALADSTGLIVTDSNRDRARHWRSSQDTTGYTESDQPELELLRGVSADARLPVFADRDAPVDPATQTVARQEGPVTVTATSYGEPFAYLPEHRPYMAIDGDLSTSWTVGEHADPIGETLRLHFDQSPGSVALVQASAPGARRITSVRVSDPGGNGPPVSEPLGDPSMSPEGQLIALPPGATTVDITIDAVAGGDPGTASAVAGVGFAEVLTGLPPTVEVVRVPSDALDAVDDYTPLAIALTRLRVDPMDRWRDDAEPILVREFSLPSARSLSHATEVRVDRRASDAELAELFDWPAVASTRLTGSLDSAGVSAIDGDDTTSWVTGFGEALGATLSIDAVGGPIDRIAVEQPDGDFSRISEIAVGAGGEERIVTLAPDATGRAEATLDPPLQPGPVEVTITALEPATTIDRRFADTVELPAAIAEIELPGMATAERVVDATISVECVPALAIDGEQIAISVVLTGQQAVDGVAVRGEPCSPAEVTMAAGPHRVEASDSGLPLQVDRVVLADVEPGAVVTGERPQATVVEDGRFHRTIEVAGCVDGCWLVFGEGYNEGWTATGPDGSLGDPQLVDGGFNGWRIEASDTPVTVTVEWTQQSRLRLAMVVSLLGVIAAIVVLVLDRRRGRPDPGDVSLPPRLSSIERDLSTRSAALLALAWTGLSALLISPEWALAGAVAGLVVIVTRRRRLVELTAWATLVMIGALVTIRERRNAPAPNGGWPGVFESWHGLAMFAVVSVLVASLFVDDDGDREVRVVDEGE